MSTPSPPKQSRLKNGRKFSDLSQGARNSPSYHWHSTSTPPLHAALARRVLRRKVGILLPPLPSTPPEPSVDDASSAVSALLFVMFVASQSGTIVPPPAASLPSCTLIASSLHVVSAPNDERADAAPHPFTRGFHVEQATVGER